MAYNNPFFPVSYQPYQPVYPQTWPQMTQQPIQQPQSQQQMPVQPQNSSIIWVANEKEAAMFPIAPNNAVTLWDRDGRTVYWKQADASGKPVMRVYDLVERPGTEQNGASEPDGKVVTYATKDDLATVVAAVRGLDGVISSIKSDMESVKGDVYGLAGKKKPTKKGDAEDDA